ncbi:hypothetical protein K466DRAFT_17711 [Polyporus arcularius HHB13444]|uniref:Uncharacterized protein n=1 Tax=Polyporus arcularius HHB13444 TaxID=1314778 RepID=A0A5C3PKJ0_9APHY|nr:hypothetical protein K466DRAFT_17711 [Polyporus arcularius HHB13444]
MRLGPIVEFGPIIPIVSAAKVSSLALWTANNHVFDDEFGLPSVLLVLGKASPGLQELSLAIHIVDCEEDMHIAFERILCPIISLPIRAFAMILYLDKTDDVHGSPVDRFLAGLDFTQRAQDVLSASTSLQKVEIGMHAHPTRGNVTARAVRD